MPAAPGYTSHWDEKFSSRPWGRYPPEDFVRFMGRNFRNMDKAGIKVLEVGCGPGANVWFLHREGYAVHGIDASPTAIALAAERITTENAGLPSPAPDLRVGDFATLDWEDESFDVIVDIFSLYANPMSVIDRALSEIRRVLKPGGHLYSKAWGRNTTGYGTGTALEEGTFQDIPAGPCGGMGVSHFFDQQELAVAFGRHLDPVVIDVVQRSDHGAGWRIEEFHSQFRKRP